MHELDTKDKATRFLDVCAKIEGLCAELYHFYSDVHRDNADISELWTKTALEEENHQKQFELAFKLRHDVDLEVKADMERTGRILEKLGSLLRHVHQNPPDIITALTRSIEMEEALADLHLESSVRFQDESIRKMFQALSEYDRDHIKALRHGLAIMTISQSEMVG